MNKQALYDYSKSKDINLRNELIEYYLYLVKRQAYSMASAYHKYISIEDLVGYGIFGLIDAIERYDDKLAGNFESYAKVRIRGAILDALRKNDTVSTYMRHKIKTVEHAVSELTSASGQTPTEAEIASYLKMDITQVQNILDDSYTFNILYLDDLLGSSESIPAESGIPDVKYDEQELLDALSESVSTFTEKERLILKLYYQEELTLKEIGIVLNLSESRISQIHSKILMELRRKLKSKGF